MLWVIFIDQDSALINETRSDRHFIGLHMRIGAYPMRRFLSDFGRYQMPFGFATIHYFYACVLFFRVVGLLNI